MHNYVNQDIYDNIAKYLSFMDEFNLIKAFHLNVITQVEKRCINFKYVFTKMLINNCNFTSDEIDFLFAYLNKYNVILCGEMIDNYILNNFLNGEIKVYNQINYNYNNICTHTPKHHDMFETTENHISEQLLKDIDYKRPYSGDIDNCLKYYLYYRNVNKTIDELRYKNLYYYDRDEIKKYLPILTKNKHRFNRNDVYDNTPLIRLYTDSMHQNHLFFVLKYYLNKCTSIDWKSGIYNYNTITYIFIQIPQYNQMFNYEIWGFSCDKFDTFVKNYFNCYSKSYHFFFDGYIINKHCLNRVN